MSTLVATVRAMVETGSTPAQILAVVEAMEAARADALERRRESDRVRQQVRRSRHVTSRDPSVTERDLSLETKVSPTPPSKTQTLSPPSPPKGGSSPTKIANRPSRRCPMAWSPSQATRQAMANEGFAAGDLERALTRMRDHEFKTARSDWDATFRNWVRQDVKFNPPESHVRPHHDLKRSSREENYARAFAGSEIAAGGRRE